MKCKFRKVVVQLSWFPYSVTSCGVQEELSSVPAFKLRRWECDPKCLCWTDNTVQHPPIILRGFFVCASSGKKQNNLKFSQTFQWAQVRTKAARCCLCQGNVGRTFCGFRYGCSEVDVPLDSLGRWRHTRAALPVLQARWMLPSSGPEVAELGLHDLPSLIDPAFQGNYACERGDRSTVAQGCAQAPQVCWCRPVSIQPSAQLCLGGTLAESAGTILWDVMLFEEGN